MTAIWASNANSSWQLLQPSQYEAEQALHDLVAKGPGRLVVVEMKLAGNPEARRAVVAQVLSYAAFLQGLEPIYLESTTLGAHLGQPGAVTILDAVRNDHQERSVDAEAFAAGLAAASPRARFVW